jgi:hypothetical protein
MSLCIMLCYWLICVSVCSRVHICVYQFVHVCTCVYVHVCARVCVSHRPYQKEEISKPATFLGAWQLT